MLNSLKKFPHLNQIKQWFKKNKVYLKIQTCALDQQRAITLFNQAQFDTCFELCLAILAREPKRYPIWNILGVLYRQWRNHAAAEFCYVQSSRYEPRYALPYSNLAYLYTDLKRYEEAITLAEKAIRLDPNFADAWNNLGNVWQRLGNIEESVRCYRKVLTLNPNHLQAFNNYLLSVQYATNQTADEIAQAHQEFGQRFAARYSEQDHKKWTNAPIPNKKLRIGYLSPDLRDHSVAYFAEPLLSHIDKTQFTVIAYDNKGLHDQVNARLRHYVDSWRVTTLWSDEQLLQQIETDQIDILVDLAGHTAGNRLSVFAKRAAPIQVTWLGHPNTTGLPTMDWRLTDWVADPVGIEYRYSERLWRLPDVFCAYRPCVRHPEKKLSPEYQPQPTPALKNGFVTFGSLNNMGKVSDKVIALWSEILKAMPTAKLLLEGVDLDKEKQRQQLLERFAQYQITEAQLILYARDTSKQYVRYHEIDICLDPFPTNGGTTTCDILWFGVPIVVLEGDSFVSRMGTTLLHTIGQTDWICKTQEEYRQKAIEMASDLSRLNNWRLHLRQVTESSPLMNEKHFAEQVEIAYRTMWLVWCEKQLSVPQLPQHIDTAAKEQARQAFKKGNYLPLKRLCEETLAIIPDDVYALSNQALLKVRSREFEQAISLYQHCLKLEPENAPIHNNLAAAYLELRQFQKSYQHAKRATELSPDLLDAWITLSASACYIGRAVEAENVARQLIASGGGEDIRLYGNLGTALSTQGRLQEALSVSRESLKKWPEYYEGYSSILFGLLYDEYSTVLDAVEIAKLFGKTAEKSKKIAWPEKYLSAPLPLKKLRIGFISGDFNNHAVMYFAELILSGLDRSQFEIYCYYTYGGGDLVTERVRRMASVFRVFSHLPAKKQYEIIYNDKVDVLIDLAGHTARNALLTMAYHPAPVQMTWLGYPGTTGLESIRWRITDRIADPEGVDDQYSETLIRLPAPFCAYRPLIKKNEWRYFSKYDVKPTPALQNGFVTFGCCNNLSKLTDKALSTWGILLKKLETARLLIEGVGLGTSEVADPFKERCKRLGIDISRLILVGRNSANQYLTYHYIDIALDPFPLTGGTTTFDLLWMGVPLVSMEGDSFRSRLSTSLLYALGQPEWLAHSEEEYIGIALKLAENIEQLNQRRLQQRAKMEKSPLMNEARFVGLFSDSVRIAWFDYCADQQMKQIENFSQINKDQLTQEWFQEYKQQKVNPPLVFMAEGVSLPISEALEQLKNALIDARTKQPEDLLQPTSTTLIHWLKVKNLAERIIESYPSHPSALLAIAEFEAAHGRPGIAWDYMRFVPEQNDYVKNIKAKLARILNKDKKEQDL